MCVHVGIYGGYGNSFHGDGGRGTRIAHLRHCLHVLVSMVSIQDSYILEELCDQGILPVLTGTYVRKAWMCVCVRVCMCVRVLV